MRKRMIARLAGLLGLALAWGQVGHAAELSHYASMPGLVNPTDLFMPPKEIGQFAYAQYQALYTTDTFRDARGRKVDSISTPLPPGMGREVDLDLDVDSWTIAPLLLWAPDWDVLGGRYGAAVLIPFGNPTVGAVLQTEVGFGLQAETSNVGIADMYVQPIWLQWSVSRLDLTFAYGFYAPTGEYQYGAADNIGLGFWSHQLQTAWRWAIDEERSFLALLALTGEINHNKEGADVVPGSHLTLNWEIAKTFWTDWLQIGLTGYDSWQVSDDSGSDAPPPALRHLDEAHAIGGQIGIPRFGLTFKYLNELRAEDRFQGQTFTLSFALPLEPVFGWARGKL